MASRNDGVVFLCYRFRWFVFAIPALEENERHAWLRISLSSVPNSSVGRGGGLRYYSALCPATESG